MNTLKEKEEKRELKPLMEIGNFGVHILKNPVNSFSFFGNVPEELYSMVFKTYEDAVEAFINFLKKQTVEWQKEHVSFLRNDIFVKFLVS